MIRNARALLGSFCLVAGGMLVSAPALAGEGDAYISSLGQDRIDLIEVNVVRALQSGIPGMQADAAQLVRDLKNIRPEQSFSDCVIPLMAIVKDEDAESGTRILAALALDELESEMGDFAISRTAQFTSDQRVKYLCTWLAYEHRTGHRSEDQGIALYEPIEEGVE